MRRESARKHRLLKLRIIAHYGGGCACCGVTNPEFLTLDHVNGGGNKHRKESIGPHIYHHVERQGFPAEFRVLCWNCNGALGIHGYCPHKNPEIDYANPDNRIVRAVRVV